MRIERNVRRRIKKKNAKRRIKIRKPSTRVDKARKTKKTSKN